MTNTISVPRDLLERIDETAICDGTEACINDDLFNELIALLAAPAVEVEGLEVIGFHCMDSAGVEALEWRGGSYADEPLCSLPKAQAIIDQLTVERDAARESMYALDELTDQQAARIAELERDICYLMGEINGEKHE